MITSNVIHRVFRLRIGRFLGTGFAIELDKKEYLVTARHLAGSLDDDCRIEVFKNGDWSQLPVAVVGHTTGNVDISVLAPSKRLTPLSPLPLTTSTSGLVYGQDAYFLGFPYEILTRFIFGQEGYPLPLVKGVIISAFDQPVFLLDGHNNPGFSGGPVVFRPPGKTDLQVAAVISGYKAEMQPILNNREESPLSFVSNTGIIVAYDIAEAITLIRLNPIGLDLESCCERADGEL